VNAAPVSSPKQAPVLNFGATEKQQPLDDGNEAADDDEFDQNLEEEDK